MTDTGVHRRLRDLSRTLGTEARTLRIGDRSVRLEGLDESLAELLQGRWGAFLGPAGSSDRVLRVLDGGVDPWLESPSPNEHYRIDALNDPDHRVVVSYHFALCADDRSGTWRVGIVNSRREPVDRVVENAVRFVVARMAIEFGGFALHAAGVLLDGRAYLFAGPSTSGKSTAVSLCRPAVSLGDDFGVVVPNETGWQAPALPFDNSERITHRPPVGPLPLAGIWRLYKSPDVRVERPTPGLAVASLMGCIAFPWAVPEDADKLLERARTLVGDGLFAHLHFRKDAGFLNELEKGTDLFTPKA